MSKTVSLYHLSFQPKTAVARNGFFSFLYPSPLRRPFPRWEILLRKTMLKAILFCLNERNLRSACCICLLPHGNDDSSLLRRSILSEANVSQRDLLFSNVCLQISTGYIAVTTKSCVRHTRVNASFFFSFVT